jgi:hypothetical protein
MGVPLTRLNAWVTICSQKGCPFAGALGVKSTLPAGSEDGVLSPAQVRHVGQLTVGSARAPHPWPLAAIKFQHPIGAFAYPMHQNPR